MVKPGTADKLRSGVSSCSLLLWDGLYDLDQGSHLGSFELAACLCQHPLGGEDLELFRGSRLHVTHLLQAGNDLAFQGHIRGNAFHHQPHGFHDLWIGILSSGNYQGDWRASLNTSQ